MPNFNINHRETIKDEKFINKITKGVYELGSIFKTFTVALAIEHELVKPNTIIKDIPKKIKCSIVLSNNKVIKNSLFIKVKSIYSYNNKIIADSEGTLIIPKK